MKTFCKEVRELATKIINWKKKDMDPLTDNEEKYYDSQKKCYTCKRWFVFNKENENYKTYKKFRDHCHFTGNLEGRLIAFVI